MWLTFILHFSVLKYKNLKFSKIYHKFKQVKSFVNVFAKIFPTSSKFNTSLGRGCSKTHNHHLLIL